MKEIAAHYDQFAERRDEFLRRNSYYYSLIFRQYKALIPSGSTILEIGCGTGALLDVLDPKVATGLDYSKKMVERAREKYPTFEFHHGDIQSFETNRKYDFIILSGTIGEVLDIDVFLEHLLRFCHPDSRVIVEYHSALWQSFLKLTELIGRKIPVFRQNWLTEKDLRNFFKLSNFGYVRKERAILLPFRIPGVSYVVNRFLAKLPWLNALTLSHFIVARPLLKEEREFSVSIIVPCRNEKGNIEALVERMPVFGRGQEIIFVEGGSSDGTYDEIERVIAGNQNREIRLFRQSNQGKGDAVRTGFDQARNELLMILDADLSVAPEDLPKFYQAQCSNKGEFINGSRLIYPMEKRAMNLLNLMGNKFFGIAFSWLLGQSLKDSLCGTKVLLKRHYEIISRNRDYFGNFDPFGDFDLIFGASRLHLKIIDLPVQYRERTYGVTNIHRWRHGWLLLRMTIFAARKIKFI